MLAIHKVHGGGGHIEDLNEKNNREHLLVIINMEYITIEWHIHVVTS